MIYVKESKLMAIKHCTQVKKTQELSRQSSLVFLNLVDFNWLLLKFQMRSSPKHLWYFVLQITIQRDH